MDETIKIQNDTHSRKSAKKYVIIAITFILFFLIAFVFLSLKSEPDLYSDTLIRYAAAAQLDKDPNELTDADFAKITELSIGQGRQIISISKPDSPLNYTKNELADIRLLDKFTNLQKLNLGEVNVSEKRVPKWMEILGKLKLIDLDKKYAIDLSPLRKLKHLEELQLGGTAVRNLKPLAGLNLKSLQLIDLPISDISPLKSLKHLHKLDIIFCPNIKYKDVEDLQMTLPNVEISGTLNLNK